MIITIILFLTYVIVKNITYNIVLKRFKNIVKNNNFKFKMKKVGSYTCKYLSIENERSYVLSNEEYITFTKFNLI